MRSGLQFDRPLWRGLVLAVFCSLRSFTWTRQKSFVSSDHRDTALAVGRSPLRLCIASNAKLRAPSTRVRALESDEVPSDEVPSDEVPSDEEMAALQARVNEARRFPVLPIVALDSMLPRQKLKFTAKSEMLARLLEEGEVGVLGLAGQGTPYRCGVTATIEQLGPDTWELCGKRHIKVVGPAVVEDDVTRAKVEMMEDLIEEGDSDLAETLEPLVQEWCGLVELRAQRFEGQMRQLLEDLGPMPPAEAAGERALWVAALINPLPALGVAFEIRPAVLLASTVRERLEIVITGIKGSIEHVSGRKRLF